MNFFNDINKYFQPHPVKSLPELAEKKIKEINKIETITSEDLHIYEGVGRRLNIEKLEWCLNNGVDNEYVRAAIKEKEMVDKIQSAQAVLKINEQFCIKSYALN